MARTYRFADGFDEPDVVAFGLPAPQLLVVIAGTATAWSVLHLGLPLAAEVPVALVVAAAAALLGWGRWLDQPLLGWAVAGARFAVSPRTRTFVLLAEGDAAGGGAGIAEDELDAETAAQPWARWLRGPHDLLPPGRRRRDDDPDDEPEIDAAAASVVISPRAATRDHGRAANGWFEPGAEAGDARDREPGLPLVVVPATATPGHDEPHDDHGDDEDEDGFDGDDAEDAVILPFARAFADETDEVDIELEGVAAGAAVPDVVTPPEATAPVFVGATRRVTFFSLNGGTGTTTLATEVAGLLAARGRHSRDGIAQERLKVALIDLDLRSATVSVRLGIPHPTIWDFVMDERATAENIDDYLVTHRSGLRALLGPPKPIAPGRAIEPARIAEVVHQLESDGYHFIFFDVASDFDAVTTWVLGAVHDIFVVLTPTAGGIQDAYRTTESLRRMGLRHKLSYVVNRARPGADFREVMRDLGGTVRAAIPYDPAVEAAENEHRLAALSGGAGADGIALLARHLYPPLRTAEPRRRLPLPWRRRAG